MLSAVSAAVRESTASWGAAAPRATNASQVANRASSRRASPMPTTAMMPSCSVSVVRHRSRWSAVSTNTAAGRACPAMNAIWSGESVL